MKFEVVLPDPPASFNEEAIAFCKQLYQALQPLTKFGLLEKSDGFERDALEIFLRNSEDKGCYLSNKKGFEHSDDGAEKDSQEHGWWVMDVTVCWSDDLDKIATLYSNDFRGSPQRLLDVFKDISKHLQAHATVPEGIPGALADVMAQIQRALDACKQ